MRRHPTRKCASPDPKSGPDSTDQRPKSQLASIGQVLQFATPRDYLFLGLAAVLAVLNGSLGVVPMIIAGAFFDIAPAATATVSTPTWSPCCGIELPLWLWLILCGVCQGATSGLYQLLTDLAKERMMCAYKTAYLKAIVRQDIEWYDANDPLQLSSVIGEQLERLGEALSPKGMIAFEMLGAGLGGISIALARQWQLGLLSLSGASLVLLTGYGARDSCTYPADGRFFPCLLPAATQAYYDCLRRTACPRRTTHTLRRAASLQRRELAQTCACWPPSHTLVFLRPLVRHVPSLRSESNDRARGGTTCCSPRRSEQA